MRCATCGERLLAGDWIVRGPDGEAYCGADCFAMALGEEAVLEDGGEETAYVRWAGYTYDEALMRAEAFDRLVGELEELVLAWQAVAEELEAEGRSREAAVYRLVARRVEELRRGWHAPTGRATVEMDPMGAVPAGL